MAATELLWSASLERDLQSLTAERDSLRRRVAHLVRRRLPLLIWRQELAVGGLAAHPQHRARGGACGPAGDSSDRNLGCPHSL